MAAGIKTHALKAKPMNITTWVHQGVRNRLYLAVMFDQSRDRLRKPMPPKPAPMKLATWLCGATQQRKASEPSIGKTYSGRNCHKVTPSKTSQNTFVCFRDSGVGFCLCFFWVSKRAV